MVEYGLIKEVTLTVEEAEAKVRDELQKVGFGIVSKIDMAEKFKEKLNEDFTKYLILGACNPKHAFAAVKSEENIGLLLPCNVIVRETKDGKTVVGFIKPTVAMNMVRNDTLAQKAKDIEDVLGEVFKAI